MSFLDQSSRARLVALGLCAGAVVGVMSAFASGRGALAGGAQGHSMEASEPRGRPMGSPRPDPSVGDRMGTAMAALGAGCVTEPALAWFGPIRELPACTFECFPVGGGCILRLGVGELGLFDVNVDGRPESFAVEGGWLVIDGTPEPPGCLLAVQETRVEGGEVTVERRCILDRAPFVAIAVSLGYDLAYIYGDARGWKDLDGDGDADLVLVMYGMAGGKESGRAFWLENTGFEATQPLTGDLNSDGHVNSADLALLLGGWTGS